MMGDDATELLFERLRCGLLNESHRAIERTANDRYWQASLTFAKVRSREMLQAATLIHLVRAEADDEDARWILDYWAKRLFLWRALSFSARSIDVTERHVAESGGPHYLIGHPWGCWLEALEGLCTRTLLSFPESFRGSIADPDLIRELLKEAESETDDLSRWMDKMIHDLGSAMTKAVERITWGAPWLECGDVPGIRQRLHDLIAKDTSAEHGDVAGCCDIPPTDIVAALDPFADLRDVTQKLCLGGVERQVIEVLIEAGGSMSADDLADKIDGWGPENFKHCARHLRPKLQPHGWTIRGTAKAVVKKYVCDPE